MPSPLTVYRLGAVVILYIYVLVLLKVSNSVLLVWPCCERDEAVLTSDHQRLLSSIMAQGLPTTIHTTFGYQEMPSKVS